MGKRRSLGMGGTLASQRRAKHGDDTPRPMRTMYTTAQQMFAINVWKDICTMKCENGLQKHMVLSYQAQPCAPGLLHTV